MRNVILHDNRTIRTTIGLVKILNKYRNQYYDRKEVMVIVWWSVKEMIRYSFLKQEDNRLKKVLLKNWLKKQFAVNRHGLILPHDNALQKLTESKYEILTYPSYSPDISINRLCLLRHLYLFLKKNKILRHSNNRSIRRIFSQ